MGDASETENAPILTVRLSPHRSLDPKGVRLLMVVSFVVSAVFSLPFYLMGAWPIVGFLGLDVALLYVAFRANFRAARAYEDFRLTYFELLFARVSARGARREWRFNPAWVRVERVDHEEFGPRPALGDREIPRARPEGRVRRDALAGACRSPPWTALRVGRSGLALPGSFSARVGRRLGCGAMG
jgi:uncharacterized membrane protein